MLDCSLEKTAISKNSHAIFIIMFLILLVRKMISKRHPEVKFHQHYVSEKLSLKNKKIICLEIVHCAL